MIHIDEWGRDDKLGVFVGYGYDDEDQLVEYTLPGKYEVCSRCRGRGVHDHPAFEDGLTSSDMEELGPDFAEEYMRGQYDVQCTECHGQRVVLVPDRDNAPPWLLNAWDADQRAAWESRAWQEAERRMGA